MTPIKASTPEALLTVIETFLSSCSRPSVLEYGENPIPLHPGFYALEIRSGRLSIEIWTETRSVCRRILEIESAATGVLNCTVQKFASKPGRLTFLDLARPQTAHRSLRGVRQNFAEQFRRMLLRQFPGWEISALSCALDLQHSFSSVFPRAKLQRGQHQIAAMACPAVDREPELLTFALLWYHHLRCLRRQPGLTSLCLFLPDGGGNLSAHRLRWLHGESLTPRLFRFNAHGSAGEVDAADLGNLQTRVSATYLPPRLTPAQQGLLVQLKGVPGVGCCPELNGAVSVRFKGLEFARLERGRILLGIGVKEELPPCQTEDVANFAGRLSGFSIAAPCAPAYPERWFESAVRSNLAAIDPDLSSADPIHGQVISFAAADRDLIDLLAISASRRLAVLELKVAEDIHLPMQALDYWMRVAWHAQRDELRHLFPGAGLSARPPKLLLIAPAMAFHSSCAIQLRYLSAAVDVERVGVNDDWAQGFKVVMRLSGANLPISHGSS